MIVTATLTNPRVEAGLMACTCAIVGEWGYGDVTDTIRAASPALLVVEAQKRAFKWATECKANVATSQPTKDALAPLTKFDATEITVFVFGGPQ